MVTIIIRKEIGGFQASVTDEKEGTLKNYVLHSDELAEEFISTLLPDEIGNEITITYSN